MRMLPYDILQVGQQDCNNGALMYVAIRDRRMFISTGKGLVSILTDDDIDYVIDHMKPCMPFSLIFS